MKCPFCNTENRDDRDFCYHCNKDLSMLRLIINKAKHHYNLALEHAERGRYYEAITELQNALDLDRSHKNAHIVLGTIYARQNKFDKAIEQWNRALALDSGLLKAHEYILKAQKVGEALPAIRWVKIFAVAFAVSIVVIISLILGGQKQRKDLPLLQTAWEAYDNHNYRAALQRLDDLIRTTTDDSVRLSSLVLRDVINDTIRRSVNTLKEQLVEGNLWKVLEESTQLASLTPDAETAALLRYVEDEARLRLIRESLLAAEAYLETGKEFEKTYAEAKRVTETFKDDKDAAELRQRIGEMETKFAAAQLASIEKRYEADGDEQSARKAAEALLARFGISHASEQIRNFIRGLEKNMIAEELRRGETALENNNFAAAYAALHEIQHLNMSDRETSDRVAFFSKRLNEAEVNSFLDEIARLDREKRFEEALAVADRGTTALLGAEELRIFEDEMASARRGHAIALYGWMEARDPQYEEARMSMADAEKTAQVYKFVLENLPESRLKWARDNILFYAGAALLKLGRYEEGKALFDTLQQDYPKSPYLKFVPRLLERFHE
jgi:tetratricopeptide (TPR) repeat protein